MSCLRALGLNEEHCSLKQFETAAPISELASADQLPGYLPLHSAMNVNVIEAKLDALTKSTGVD